MARRWPRRRGDVGEAFEELVDGGLPVVDCGAFIIGQRDGGEHALQVVLRLQKLTLAGVFRGVEVALGAGHAVLALLNPALRPGLLPCKTGRGVRTPATPDHAGKLGSHFPES